MRSPALQRFLDSLHLTYDQWHDGEGFDLAALAELEGPERAQALEILDDRLASSGAGWREVDAVAALDGPGAHDRLEQLAGHRSGEVRLRAARHLSERGRPEAAEREIVRLLRAPELETGIDALMTLAEDHPTPAVREALLYCAVDGAPDLRVHAAALALYLAGGADSAFDWNRRPLFLQFGEEDRQVRVRALDGLKALMP